MLSLLMSSVYATDTTKFCLAWLIIWIIVTVALAVLAVLKMVKFPALFPSNLKIVFAVLQLAIFALFLAAMADDTWSSKNGFGLGVTGGHDADKPGNNYNKYSSSGLGGDDLDFFNTVITAGAFTLIFGVLACIVSLVLLIGVGADAAGKAMAGIPVPLLGNLQWIFMMGSMMIWAVSAQGALNGASSAWTTKPDLGNSWILCFVAMVLALIANFSFAGFDGGGAAAQPSTTSTAPPPPQ